MDSWLDFDRDIGGDRENSMRRQLINGISLALAKNAALWPKMLLFGFSLVFGTKKIVFAGNKVTSKRYLKIVDRSENPLHIVRHAMYAYIPRTNIVPCHKYCEHIEKSLKNKRTRRRLYA